MSDVCSSEVVLKKIIDNVEQVIVGKRETIELLIMALISGGHVLLEDVPGVGKTSLVAAIAKSIHASYRRIQFTPDILPSDITGFSIFNRRTGEFEYKPGSIMSQIILADEINRSSPKTQASLLEVMEEHQVTVDGVTYKLPAPFMVLATQNPVDYIGTYPLPEAQLDRFFMKISLGYPSPQEEYQILLNLHQTSIHSLKPVAEFSDVLKIQEQVKKIFIDESILRYIVDITNKTRNHPDINLGSSPRGSIALFKASQACALYHSRNYVIPDDVKKVAVPVLTHRILFKQDSRLKKGHREETVNAIIDSINVPLV